MNYYLSTKLGDPFIAYFSTQLGDDPVKTIVVHNLAEKAFAKQISKLAKSDSDSDSDTKIAFSSDLTTYILNTPNFLEKVSNILENDYSIGIISENIGVCLHIYPICL